MSSTANTVNTANTVYTDTVQYDYYKRCTHCRRKGFEIENCAYKKEEEEEKVLLLSPCEQCHKMGHIKKKCDLIPDSPRTKYRKYQSFIAEEDYQGGAEYLQEQYNKKLVLMTPKEHDAHLEKLDYLDDDYMWSSYS